MLKNELIKKVAAVTGQTRDTVRQVLDGTLEVTLNEVKAGNDVMAFGLGKISVGQRGAKTARNLHTGEKVIVPPRAVVLFRPSVALDLAAKSV